METVFPIVVVDRMFGILFPFITTSYLFISSNPIGTSLETPKSHLLLFHDKIYESKSSIIPLTVLNMQHQSDDESAKDQSTSISPPPVGFAMEQNVITEEKWNILQHWINTNEWLLVPSNKHMNEEEENNNNFGLFPLKSAIPWEIGGQSRKVAQFGDCRYNYEQSCVEFNSGNDNNSDVTCKEEQQKIMIPPIPEPLRSLLELDKYESCLKTKFTQCIINVYNADTIIPWHYDDMEFGSLVLVFVFGENRPLYMRQQHQREEGKDDHDIVQSKQQDVRESIERNEHITTNENENNNRKNNTKSLLPWKEFRLLEWKEGSEILDAKQCYDYYIAYPKHGSIYILQNEARYQWEHSVPAGNGLRISITFRNTKREMK